MLPTHEQGKTRGKSDSFGTSPAAGPSGGERGGARKGKSQSESVQARQTDKESQASDVLYCVGIGDQFPLRSNEIDRLGGWGGPAGAGARARRRLLPLSDGRPITSRR